MCTTKINMIVQFDYCFCLNLLPNHFPIKNVIEAQIKTKKVIVPSRVEIELWATPLYFLLIMVVVTIEWIVRKFSYLK